MSTNGKTAIECVSIRALGCLMILCTFACFGKSAQADETEAVRSVFSRSVSNGASKTKPQAAGKSKGLEVVRPIEFRDWSAKFGLQTKFHVATDISGERIRHVTLGSLADELHLRAGDTIVAVNGSPLENAQSWDVAVERVSRLGGWLTLKVKDGKTGVTAYRTANLRSILAD